MKNSEVVALIPARGGSKSIPKKNIYPIEGKPLIAYSIETALQCPSIDRVIVSTDSAEIAEVARAFGAEVPFLRPDEFARDDTTDLPVFVHCLKWLREHEGVTPGIWVHLRPTSPYRDPQQIEKAVHALQADPEADAVRAVCEPRQENPFKMWKIDGQGYLTPLVPCDLPEPYNQPRQKLPKVYWQNGYVDVTRSRTLLEKHSMTGDRIKPLVIDTWEVLDIDDPLTLEYAGWLKRKRMQK